MHVLFFIVAFWAILVSSLKMNNKLLNLIIAFIPAYIMIATRINWLPDDPNYYEHWMIFHGTTFSEYLLSMGSGSKFEPGFWLLEQIPSFNFTTVLISTLYISTLIYVIYSLVPEKYYPFVIALVFFNPQFATSLSARRTTVAMCLYMIAVVLKSKGGIVVPIILAILAVLFHNTAVFMLPSIFIPLNFAEKHLNLVELGIIAVMALTILFPDFFAELFIENSEDTALEHYAHYAKTSSSLSLAGLVQELFIATMVVLAIQRYKVCPKNNGYSYIFIIAMVYFLLSMLNIGQARIKVYSSLFAFAFIALSYQQRSKNNNSQTLFILFVVFMIFSYFLWYQKLDGYPDSFSVYSSFLF